MNPLQKFQNWIEGLVKVAVDEAVKDLEDALVAEIQSMETNLTAQITSLPGLLASQIQNVALDSGAVATKVIAGVAAQLTALPQQIISGVIQGLNPFKDER